MKKTCLLLSIGCVGFIGLSARSAQAQTAPATDAPSVMPTVTVTTESAAAQPAAVQPAATRRPSRAVAQREPGTTIAEPVVVQPAPKSSSFVRVPMVSRIFPAMWQ